jgi:hypothetical protein
MARLDKWFPGVSPDEQTSDVAERTLRFRFDAVQHYLILVAQQLDEDIDYDRYTHVETRHQWVNEMASTGRIMPPVARVSSAGQRSFLRFAERARGR